MSQNLQLATGWPERPAAGVCNHFSSLPSPFGIGDIGDASLNFLDQLVRMKLRVWQVLPVGPTGFGDSPYQTLSAFAGNEILIGPEPLVREGLLDQSDLQPLTTLPKGNVEHESLIPVKQALLNKAASRFLKESNADSITAFRAFCNDENSLWLHHYALFRVLKTKNNDQAWTHWNFGNDAHDRATISRIEKDLRNDIERVKVIQFFFHRQWQQLHHRAAQLGIKLFGDIPIYIALDSADAWYERGLLKMDSPGPAGFGQPTHVAGVPPDYFSEDGQLWGNPLYDWESQKKTNYRWWIARLKQASSRYDMVRIDHFRALDSYWSIPAEATLARNGKWLPGPGDSFLDAIGKATRGLTIVAEDLGIITNSVTELRQRHRLPGMRVLQFELSDPKFDPDEIPQDCVCYTGTHDNDTTVGWFSGASFDKASDKEMTRQARKLRRTTLRLTGGSVETMHFDLIRLAFSTRARVAIAPMQDFLGLGSEARLNNPGTTQGNWRWRMLPDQLSGEVQDRIARLVKECSRF